MTEQVSQVGSYTSFSKSKLWDINAHYYKSHGLDAWRSDKVPHQLSSNSMVGKTYAELILGYLKDLAFKGQTKETLYIVELGAGHGRLAYHVIKHLDRLIALTHMEVPDYCYVLTDIVEDNLQFFSEHPQFKDYFDRACLDVSFFDAMTSDSLVLRHQNKTIKASGLNQSMVVIGNYFFDSIPTDLFHAKGADLYACDVSLNQKQRSENFESPSIDQFDFSYKKDLVLGDYYEQAVFNNILFDYKNKFEDSHFYFPIIGMECLARLQALTTKGLMLLSIDKGMHELSEMHGLGEPDIMTHGSFSIWVNYHVLAELCSKSGGVSYLPSFAGNQLQCVSLLFDSDGDNYVELNNAFQRFVNDFGPDDFNTIKMLSYDKISVMSIQEIITMLRLSHYDSTMFANYLPRLKQLAKELSMRDRRRLGETMHKVWGMYFSIGEPFDLPFELGGFFYDLSFHEEALFYFKQSIKLFGPKADTYYNMVLSHYQLRQDKELVSLIVEAKKLFPDYPKFAELDKLNLHAK